MQGPNYYVVLGVTPDANPAQLRKAYRRLCHECHPDHDRTGADRFIRPKNAYQALTDPAERSEHDRALGLRRPRKMPRPISHSPIDLIRDFERHTPSAEEIIATFARNFTHRHEPKAVHARDVNLEVVLTPAEAARGCAIPLSVPVFRPCQSCSGTGVTGSYRCDICDGHGSERIDARVDVIVPARTVDGTAIPISLKHLGITNLYLRVLVHIAA